MQLPLSFHGGSVIKNMTANAGDIRDLVQFRGWDNPPQKEMEAHSNVLAWEIPWTEDPGGLYSPVGSRVRHD